MQALNPTLARKSARRLRLFAKVTAAHLGVVAALYLAFQLPSCSPKPTEITKVKIVTASEAIAVSPAPPLLRPPEPKPRSQTPEPPKPPEPKPPDPKPKRHSPELPKPPSPMPPEPKPTPSTKTIAPKVAAKTEPTPKPPKPVTSVPEKSYRTPEEIRQSGKLTKSTPAPTPKPRVRREFDESGFKEKLASANPVLDIASTAAAAGNDAYIEVIMSELYRLWDQPNRAEVGSTNPSVTLRIKIARSGSILAKTVITPSGRPSMDNSVTRLLQKLQQFPPFPQDVTDTFLETDVVLKLRD